VVYNGCFTCPRWCRKYDEFAFFGHLSFVIRHWCRPV